MGIPSYFTYIVKNYSNIIKNVHSCDKVNNLFIDCNSIIYDCIREIEANKETYTEFTLDVLVQNIINTIDSHINIVNPSDLTYIAFDGVAPLAKLEQQRTRRYKSNFLSKFESTSSAIWDTTAITPGTPFMNELNLLLMRNFPVHKYTCKIKISTSSVIGEGEHKIFGYIRKQSVQNVDFHNTHNIVYGLDADLFMLALANLQYNKNIYLYRETPHFIKTIDSSLDPNKSYLIDIPVLATIINSNLNANKNANKNHNNIDRILDYVFLCFLLGNDFLPHFPALNIRTNGIEYIMNTYKSVIGNTSNTIILNNSIQWRFVHKIMNELSLSENDYINKEYYIRDKQQQNVINKKNEHTHGTGHTADDINNTVLNLPITDRHVEHYINPTENGWQSRYYKKLFDMNPSEARIKQICTNYLEGLEWSFKYYISNCPDWRWKYKYNYPPLIIDLFKYVPYFETIFIEPNVNTAVDPYVQLSYVLPKEKFNNIPTNISSKLLEMHNTWYPTEYDFEWSYCRYFWESHIKLPEINIGILEKLVEGHKN